MSDEEMMDFDPADYEDAGDDNAEEDYGFSYDTDEDPGGEDDLDVQISNLYHESKEKISTDTAEALEGFSNILDMEQEKGEMGFKALKQIVKLRFNRNEYEQMMKAYDKLLTYIKSAVTRNESEKVINSLIEYVSASTDMSLLLEFYEKTLSQLALIKNERLWFKTNLSLGKLRFDREEYSELATILKELRKSCQLPDGSEDLKKGTQLLEIYALEIQMYTAQKNNKMLRKLYDKSLQVQSGIPHPKIMAVIRECGGKMHMAEENWGEAYKEFYEAFKNYDEAGSTRRIQSLKLMVIANLLDLSDINPFGSPEAASYVKDPQIVAFSQLVQAYERNDTQGFEKTFLENKDSIMDDKFISELIEERLLKNIRMKGLELTIASYSRVKIDFLSEQLNISSNEVQNLLISMILDNKIHGRIDQVNKVLILEMAETGLGSVRYRAFDKWSRQLGSLSQTVVGKLKD